MRPLVLLVLAICIAAFPAAAQSDIPAGYSLEPGDALQIDIWREQDLSGEFVVNADGVITLPLLGRQTVAGVPVERLHDQLMEQYSAHLRNPSITITPKRRVNIFGEVNRPGLYALDPTVSLAGAIAMAGGATEAGNLTRILIVRDGMEIRQGVGGAETLTAADVRSGDQIIVGRRSWFDRNSALLMGSALNVVTTIITTLIILNNNSN
jgi:polysaccharide biosynthesis/export protein